MITNSGEIFRRKLGGRSPDIGNEADDRDLKLKVRELLKQVEEIIDLVQTREFANALNRLAENGDEIEKALISWVEVIELLVQDREVARGHKSGQGHLKKNEVKQAVRYLLRAEEIDFPNIPDHLEPIVIDIAVDWTIEAVVQILNDNNSCWLACGPQPWYERLSAGLKQLIVGLLDVTVFRMISWLWDLRHSVDLPPRLQSAVDRVVNDGSHFTLQESLSATIKLTQFIGNNAEGIKAFVRVASESVKEAEFFLASGASGPEKKDHARKLVLAVLEEWGLVPEASFYRIKIDFAVSAAIEVSVRLFKKRSVLSSSRS